jgi:hypothetical protein
MKIQKIFIFLFIFIIIQTVCSEQIIDEMNINVTSSVDVEIVSDYYLNVSDIKIGSKENLEIVSGQSLLLKYNFLNKLDYDISIDFWLGDFSEDLLENIELLLLKETNTEEECLKEGYLLAQNTKKVKVSSNNENNYLCVIKDLQNKSKIELNLASGNNSRYILFKSNHKVIINGETNYNIKSFVDLKEVFISEDVENTVVDENKQTSKINPNYDINEDINNITDKTQQHLNNIIEETSNIKRGVAGFVTLGFTSFSIVVLGLLAVIVLAMFITKNKKEYKNIDDLNKL